MHSGMTAPTFDYARSKGSAGKIGQLNPMRRYGVAEEIAPAVRAALLLLIAILCESAFRSSSSLPMSLLMSMASLCQVRARL